MPYLEKLKRSIESGRIILEEYKKERKPRQEAIEFADKIKGYIVSLGINASDIYFGGSIRREKPTVGDVDILICDPKVDEAFYQKLESLLKEKGHSITTKVMGASHFSVLVDDFLIEFKKTTPENLGAAQLFVTGSGDFNMSMRAYAKHLGYALSQYGLKKRDTGEVVASSTEQDIFKALGIPYVEPKDRGEFTAPKGAYDNKPAYYHPGQVELIPPNIWAKVPDDVKAKLKENPIPAQDDKGNNLPSDFLWSKTARQNYYKRRGSYKLPDEFKLDRYL